MANAPARGVSVTMRSLVAVMLAAQLCTTGATSCDAAPATISGGAYCPAQILFWSSSAATCYGVAPETNSGGSTTVQARGSGTGTAGFSCSNGSFSHPSNESCQAGPAFYVAPNGNNSNRGTSPSSPFLTLEAAQAAMENSGSIKTTYLMGGTYNRTQDLQLTKWNDGDQAWLAYPGQRPVLDGGGRAAEGVYIISTGVVVHGLTIQNFSRSGIFAKYSGGLALDNNTILNITSPDWRTNILAAGIFFSNVSNSSVTHNYVNNETAPGISIEAGSTPGGNDLIAYNLVTKACTATNDCGAIYTWDEDHVLTGIQIINNIVGDFGPPSQETRGIYLDNETSHVTVANNIVYGPGTWPLMIHGGNDVVVRNNIFDLKDVKALAFYQDDVGSGHVNYGMAANVFTANIIYSPGPFPAPLWDYLNQSGGTIALPTDSGNLYYTPSGVYNSTSGTIIDAKPAFANPLFVNPGANNYELQSGSPASQSGFVTIDTSAIGPIGR